MNPPDARENGISPKVPPTQSGLPDTKDLVELLDAHFKRHPSHVLLAKCFLKLLAVDSLSPNVCQAIDLLTHLVLLNYGIEAVEKGYKSSGELESSHRQRGTRTQQEVGGDHAGQIVKNQGRNRRLTDEEVAKMFKMFDEQNDIDSIATHFGVTTKAVNYRHKQWKGIIPRSEKRRRKSDVVIKPEVDFSELEKNLIEAKMKPDAIVRHLANLRKEQS